MKHKKKLLIIGCMICLISAVCVGFDIYKNYSRRLHQNAALQEPETVNEKVDATEENTIEETPEAIEESPSEEMILPETKETEKLLPEPVPKAPVITEPIIPKDIYVIKGTAGKIKCYAESAKEYIWEYYDEGKKDWRLTSENTNINLLGETDELNRNISTLIIPGIEENEELLVRCRIKAYPIEGESSGKESFPEDSFPKEGYPASVHILPYTAADIISIDISEQIEAEAGTYLSISDIPVTIKTNEAEEIVTGLSGLFFCVPKDVSGAVEKREDGTTIETVTTTSIEKEYRFIDAGENDVIIRYRGQDGQEHGIDTETSIMGTDNIPPKIEVTLSPYTVTSKELENGLNIKVNITAEDNYSPLTKLLYAFKPQKEKTEDIDFQKNSKLEMPIKDNGIWTAYVKDEAGNIGTKDIEIIVTDQKAPVIESVALKEEGEGWHKENVIVVTATDKTETEYCYTHEESNVDSGWTKENEYAITQNGVWTISVKDAAGNESSEEITVNNVDNMPPVILSVNPKEEKESGSEPISTGTLEDRVSVTVNGREVKESNETENGYIDTGSVINPDGQREESVPVYSGAISAPSYSTLGNYKAPVTTAVKGEKGERGEQGASGAAGKDGTNAFMHIKYAENETGVNMSDAPTDSSLYIGVYTGSSSVAPASATSYRWSRYKGNSSYLHIRYAENESGQNMTEKPIDSSLYMGVCNTMEAAAPAEASSYVWSRYREPAGKVYFAYAEDAAGTGMMAEPTDSSSYIGICSTTDMTAPDNPESYTWSKYKDTEVINQLKEQINSLQEQIDSLKTP